MESRVHKHFWVLVCVTLTWCLANYPIMGSLWEYSFDDGTYSHAYLVPFIVLYLFYILEQENRVVFRAAVSLPWLCVAALSGVGLVLATWSQISLLYWAASLGTLLSLVCCIFRFSISTLFPFAFLVFIFPFWGSLAVPLQSLSVYVVTALMGLTSIPVYVENEFVTIPAGIFEIAEGCSGLRYVIVSAAISSLYVFLYLKTIRSALIFSAISLAGALVTNWLRIVALIVIGHETDMQSSLMTDHNNFGWYIYIPVAIFQFYIGRKLEDKEAEGLGSATASNTQKIVPLKVNVIVSTGLIALVLSSASAVWSGQYDNQSNCQTQQLPVMPNIVNADLLCTQQEGDVYLATYFFYGTSLDNKASYYLNSPVPQEFKKMSAANNGEWNTVTAKNGDGDMFAIAYRYGTDFGTYLSLIELKKARLKNAVRANTSSNIQWRMTHCGKTCNRTDIERVVP